MVGMVSPFHREGEKLKSASYEVDFDGVVYYWEDGDKKEYTRKKLSWISNSKFRKLYSFCFTKNYISPSRLYCSSV